MRILLRELQAAFEQLPQDVPCIFVSNNFHLFFTLIPLSLSMVHCFSNFSCYCVGIYNAGALLLRLEIQDCKWHIWGCIKTVFVNSRILDYLWKSVPGMFKKRVAGGKQSESHFRLVKQRSQRTKTHLEPRRFMRPLCGLRLCHVSLVCQDKPKGQPGNHSYSVHPIFGMRIREYRLPPCWQYATVIYKH